MSRKYTLEAWVIYVIVQDFMAQSGDPTGTGRGGTSIYGSRLSVWGVLSLCSYALIHRCSEDELHPELRFTGAGILAMANSGPNTNGTCILSLSTRPV